MELVFISQPMRGIPEEEIEARREKTMAMLMEKGYSPVDNYFSEKSDINKLILSPNVKHAEVCYLARAIDIMSKCDAVYFCKGWEDHRGCRVEHQVASDYGLKIIEEE